jgi:hypothetical protein
MIHAAEAKRLPLRLRLAWGCTVVERVAHFYSPHARQKYFLDETLDSLWEVAQRKAGAKQRCRELMDRLDILSLHFREKVPSERDEEGYTLEFATMGVCLLNELGDDNGRPVITAIYGDAATCYANHVLYCHGIGAGTGLFWPGHPLYDKLMEPVWQLSESLYQEAMRDVGQRIGRNMFDQIEMDVSLRPLPADLLASETSKPPAAEVSWIQYLGRGVRPI